MSESLRNTHLSYSRLSRFERCPKSYQLHYLEQLPSEPNDALRFGKAIHSVLEHLVREVVEDERTGPLVEARALELYQQAWTNDGMGGAALFHEGVTILKEFVRQQGVLDHMSVLAIEKPFELEVGRHSLIGYMDRVDCLADGVVRIWDYKTSRALFSKEELDSSLQMSIYFAAARKMWPWARTVKLGFWMLRHGIHQHTDRTPEQIESALRYVETLGIATETATEFPARLSTYCAWCDHKANCAAYENAIKGNSVVVSADSSDLEAVAREREEVATLAKLMYQRKEQLDLVLKASLKQHPELVLNGTRYRMLHTTSLEHELGTTLDLLTNATGLPRDEIVRKIAVVDKKALESMLKGMQGQLDKSRVLMLKAELEARADKHYSPRLWASPVERSQTAEVMS